MLIPLVPGRHIDSFTGLGVDVSGFGNKNCVVGQYPDGRQYLTQRPSINISVDASATVSDAKGRGLYYWAKVSKLYFVNADTVYADTYSSALTSGTITESVNPVFFAELGTKLVIIDDTASEGWYVDSAASSTLAAISDTDFTGLTLAGGVAVMDGFLFIMDTDGNIWNFDSNSVTSLTATSFVNAEREPDGGVYIDRHGTGLVAFGQRSIEFFYNAGNASGSVLARRDDVIHHVGLLSSSAIHKENDTLTFIGVTSSALGVYRLENYQLNKISTPEFDSYLTQAHVKEGAGIFASGMHVGGRTFFCITLHNTPGAIAPGVTFVYDGVTFTEWDTSVGGLSKFPVIGFTVRTGANLRTGEGIMTNGDIFTFNDDFNPQDTLLGSAYAQSGYAVAGYYATVERNGTTYTMDATTGLQNYGSNAWKFFKRLEVVAEESTTASDTDSVSWADGNSSTFGTVRTLDATKKSAMTRMGRAKQRNYKYSYSGSTQRRVIGFDVDVAGGSY